MKTIMLALSLLAISLAAHHSAYGQCSPVLRAEVPFDFVVNGKSAKAGNYTIEKTNCLTATPTVVLRDGKGKPLGVINRSAVEVFPRASVRAPLLTFERSGGEMMLSEVLDPAGRYSFRIRKDRRVRDLAGKQLTERVTVPLLKGCLL